MFVLGDAISAPALLIGGVIGVIFITVIVVAIESVVLWLLKWGRFRVSLLDAFVANVLSILAGVVMLILLLVFAPSDVWPWLLFFGYFLLSVVIEWLWLRRRGHPPRQTWIATIVMNVASYALLALLQIMQGGVWF